MDRSSSPPAGPPPISPSPSIGCFEKSELIHLLVGKIDAPKSEGRRDDTFLRGILGAGPALAAAYQMNVSVKKRRE